MSDTDRASSAPDVDGAEDTRDDANAAAVLDDAKGTPGGGMGGAAAVEPVRAPEGVSPNAPVDTAVDSTGEAEAAARERAVDDMPPDSLPPS